MKTIKFVGLSLLGTVGLILVIGIFLPDSYVFERSIEIKSSPEAVYSHIADYRKWKSWSPWAKVDPNATYTIEGTPGTPGMKMSWVGNKDLGKGSLTLTDATPPLELIAQLQFFEPMKSQSTDRWYLEPNSSGTLVRWQNVGKLDYPMGRIMGLFMDKFLAKDFEKGLASLKETVESTSQTQ